MTQDRYSFWTEAERLDELARYRIAATTPEADYDKLAQDAAAIAGTPIALLTFLTEDHQYFKAAVGTQLTGTIRAISFCTHAIEQPGTMVVPDASRDERFSQNPLVTGETNIRFYAGVPLLSPRGLPLGTLCVLDQMPRDFTPAQQAALETVAAQVIDLLEQRKTQVLKPTEDN